MTKIETAIPLPAPRPRRGRLHRWPWDGMEIGHSFLAEGIARNAIRTTATYQEQRRGWKFQVESEGEAFRVFRIA